MTIPAVKPLPSLESPARDRLTLLGDLNLAEFIRHTARFGGTILEEDGLLLFTGEHPHPGPYRNGAIRLENRLSAAETMDRIRRFFRDRSRSFVLWVRDHADGDLDEAARAAGMGLLEPEGLPELCCEEIVEPAAIPDGVELNRVEDHERRKDFVLVNAESWGLSGISLEVASTILFRPESLDVPYAFSYLAYVDGKPAASAMALNSHGVTGGYWSATVPWARRRGLHDLCVRASFRDGFAMGARLAVCQTSRMAAGNMQRMGFHQITRYLRYLGRPPGATWD